MVREMNDTPTQEILSVYTDLVKAIQLEDSDIAAELEEEVNKVTLQFRGFHHPEYDSSLYKELLKKLEAFEDSVVTLAYMEFFYGYIGRIALNAGETEKAIQYALAGVEICEIKQRKDGVSVNKMLLCDIALSLGSAVHAERFYNDAGLYEKVPFKVLASPENDELVTKLLRVKKRPKTYRFLRDANALVKECKVRLIMKNMRVSRQAALRYFK